MSQGQRLFSTGKISAFVDTYSPGVEKRRGETVSVISVKFRVQPFDAALASSLDEGVGEDCNIRPTVFTMNSAEPKPNFTRHDFRLALERQNLEIFSTPDTPEARIALLQAKISGLYVRTQKDMNALALVFKATFGPVGRDELELIHSLHRSQAFITFQQAEPLLEMEEDDGGDDAEPGPVVDGRVPAPMWDDDEKPETAADAPDSLAFPKKKSKLKKTAKPGAVAANRKLHSHQSKAKGAKRR